MIQDVTEAPRNVHKGGIINLVFARYYAGDLDKDNKMKGECSTHDVDEIHI